MPRNTKEYNVWINGDCYHGIHAIDCYGACEYVLQRLGTLPPENAEISANEVSYYRGEHGSFALSEFDLGDRRNTL